MPAYMVRRRVTHEAVGLYSAQNEGELWTLVDEITAPSSCEYAVIPSGGIVWNDATAKALPLQDVECNEEMEPVLTIVGPVSVSERWFNALMDGQLSFEPLQNLAAAHC